MKLVVADDSVLLREGLVGLLERRGHRVIAEASNAVELEALVNRHMEEDRLDVVLTDVRMPPQMKDDGLKAAMALRARYPRLGVLVLSQYVAPAYATELFAAPTVLEPPGGGVGYLLKDRISRVADFMHSLGIVAGGGVVVDPEVAAHLMRGKRSALDALTPRELEVLELMASGLSNQQISEKLFISSGAVAKHVANVFAKLNLGPGEENRRVRAVLAYLTERSEI